VFVANHGRQPIAITQTGLEEKRRVRLAERPGSVVSAILEAWLTFLLRIGFSDARIIRWQRPGGWFARIFGEWTAPDSERRPREH
jgi:hypothetical protein